MLYIYLSAISVLQKRLKLFHAGKNIRASVNRIALGRLAVEGLDLLRVEQLGKRKLLWSTMWLYGAHGDKWHASTAIQTKLMSQGVRF